MVRFARYGANFIPRNAPVLADVDDINNNIGFWRPQADFRIPERLSPGFTNFPDVEIEAMFEDMVKTFVRYQADIGERAIRNHPDADLVMVYIEQPDGSEHQFLLTDPRQGTNPTDPNSIGTNQDPAKVARYASYIRFAYQTADKAVKQIADAAGRDSNVIVVSDHGFAPFHTSVSMTNILRNAGIDTTKVAIRTSGPAANIYVNLQNRESGRHRRSGDLQRAGNADHQRGEERGRSQPASSTSRSRTGGSSPWSRPGRCSARPGPDSAPARPSARISAMCSR